MARHVGVTQACSPARVHLLFFSMQRSGDAPPLPPQHQHLQTERGDPRLGKDALRSAMLTGSRKRGDGTAHRETLEPLGIVAAFCTFMLPRCLHS